MKMTSGNFDQFRKDLKAAVANIEKKYGVTVETGNISYTEDSFNLKLKVTNEGVEEKMYNQYIETNVAIGMEAYRPLLGQFGKVIRVGTKSYEIVGANPRSKYDIIVKDILDDKLVNYKGTALAYAIK